MQLSRWPIELSPNISSVYPNIRKYPHVPASEASGRQPLKQQLLCSRSRYLVLLQCYLHSRENWLLSCGVFCFLFKLDFPLD